MALETTPFDAAPYLTRPEAQAELIEEAVQSGDPAYIVQALGVIARARGMSQVAKDSGLARESLYKALTAGGNPSFATVAKVAKALHMRIAILPEPV